MRRRRTSGGGGHSCRRPGISAADTEARGGGGRPTRRPLSRGVSGGREPYPAGGGGGTWLTGARRAATCGWSGSTVTGVTSAATTSTTRRPRRSSTSWRGSAWSTAPGSTGRNSTWGTRTTSSGTAAAGRRAASRRGPRPPPGSPAPRPGSSPRPLLPPPLERGSSMPPCRRLPQVRSRAAAAIRPPRPVSAVGIRGARRNPSRTGNASSPPPAPPARASPWVETAWKWVLAVGFNGPVWCVPRRHRCAVPKLVRRWCGGVPGAAPQPEGRCWVPGRP